MRRETPGPARFPDHYVKKALCVLSILAAGLLGFNCAGCKKQGSQQPPESLEAAFQKLRASLVKASPEVQSNLYNGVDYNLRYDNYLKAMMFLDRIATDPSLNEQQKKDVNQVIEMVKVKVQGNAPPPAR